MKEKLKAFALRIAFSRLGPTIVQLVSGAVGFLLGWIVKITSAVGFEMTADDQTQFSLVASAGIYWVIFQIINNYAGKHANKLQTVLQTIKPDLKLDDWIGPETIGAAKEAAQKAALNLSTGEIYEGKVGPFGGIGDVGAKGPVAKITAKPKPKRKPVIPYNPKR